MEFSSLYQFHLIKDPQELEFCAVDGLPDGEEPQGAESSLKDPLLGEDNKPEEDFLDVSEEVQHEKDFEEFQDKKNEIYSDEAGPVEHHCDLCQHSERGGATATNSSQRPDLELGSVHTPEGPFLCEHCGAIYSRSRQLELHKQRAHVAKEPFQCRVCNFICLDEASVETHHCVRTEEEPAYQCRRCDVLFSRKSRFEAHWCSQTRVIPNDTDPVEDPCQDSETSATAATNSSQLPDPEPGMVHLAEGPYVCELCGATYGQSSHLELHKKRVHTEEKPFQCRVCNFNHTDQASLDAHDCVRGAEEEPACVYRCLGCDVLFSRKSDVDAHSCPRTTCPQTTCSPTSLIIYPYYLSCGNIDPSPVKRHRPSRFRPILPRDDGAPPQPAAAPRTSGSQIVLVASRADHPPVSAGSSKKAQRYDACCSVLDCNNYIHGGTSMHRFPRHRVLRRQWQMALRMNRDVSSSARVCGDHFLPKDYTVAGNKRRRLRPTAVPSQKLSVWSHDAIEENQGPEGKRIKR